jgi:hypothetical protein
MKVIKCNKKEIDFKVKYMKVSTQVVQVHCSRQPAGKP